MKIEEFQKRFIELRNKLNLTDKEISKLFGVSRPTIERWIEGISAPHPALAKVAIEALEQMILKLEQMILKLEQMIPKKIVLSKKDVEKLIDTCEDPSEHEDLCEKMDAFLGFKK